jgi:bacterioferritin-associated ferredoxin
MPVSPDQKVSRMYVCICNAVTEDDVRCCVVAGACSTKEVRSACGMQPGCGSCTKRLRALVSESLTAVELVDSITGGPAPLTIAARGPVHPEITAEADDTRSVQHAA